MTKNKPSHYDVVVIGAGPGGYVAAIRAAQLGFATACIEQRDTLGGTCLNIGCIPSKALLHASELYHKSGHEFAELGIDTKPKLNLSQMMAHKLKIVDDLTKGIEFLFKKNKITHIRGRAEFSGKDSVTVTAGSDKGTSVTAKYFIIAAGSTHTDLPGVTIDEKDIVSSTGALSFKKVPKHLTVIGGGVIGLELGSVWRRLGAEVTVVEFLDRITPNLDSETSKNFMRILQKQGMTFKLGYKVTGIKSGKAAGKSDLSVQAEKGGDALKIACDKVLVAIGRRPATESLGLDKAGVTTDERGFIKVNEDLQTDNPQVWAIGDCVPGPMLAHKAEEEGVCVAERLAGQKPKMHYHLVPGVIYTHPEVADIGYGEDALKEQGVEYKIGKFPMQANSRARANSEVAGQVKILSDAVSDRILGASIIGVGAGEMIHEIAVLMEFGGSAEDLARTCHAHPTFSEAVKEAALAVDGRAIHA